MTKTHKEWDESPNHEDTITLLNMFADWTEEREQTRADMNELVELVHQVIEWYDVDDDQIANTSELFEKVRGVFEELKNKEQINGI